MDAARGPSRIVITVAAPAFFLVSGFTAKQQCSLPGPWPGRSACGKHGRGAGV